MTDQLLARPDPDEGRDELAAARERIEEFIGAGSDRELALAARIVANFSEKVATLTAGLLAAAAAGDPVETAFAAHALKGAASNVGALRLAALCERLETLARVGRCDHVLPARVQLDRLCHDFALLLDSTCAEFPALVAIHPRATVAGRPAGPNQW